MLASETLEISGDGSGRAYCCRRCQASLGPADANYKLTALIEESPVSEANPLIGDPQRFVDQEMVYRHFYCPGCGGLLDTEVARAEDPPLWDIQLSFAEGPAASARSDADAS
jgi:acetone carboxylase gamma subunit